MKRKAILKEVTLRNAAFKMVVKQSAIERKIIHEEIVQGSKEAAIVKELSVSQKKNNYLPSETISDNTTDNKKCLTTRINDTL